MRVKERTRSQLLAVGSSSLRVLLQAAGACPSHTVTAHDTHSHSGQKISCRASITTTTAAPDALLPPYLLCHLLCA